MAYPTTITRFLIHIAFLSLQCRLEVPRITLAHFFCLACSGWWSNSTICAELPFLIAELPEQDHMGNLLAVMTQFGNVSAVLYIPAPASHDRKRDQRPER